MLDGGCKQWQMQEVVHVVEYWSLSAWLKHDWWSTILNCWKAECQLWVLKWLFTKKLAWCYCRSGWQIIWNCKPPGFEYQCLEMLNQELFSYIPRSGLILYQYGHFNSFKWACLKWLMCWGQVTESPADRSDLPKVTAISCDWNLAVCQNQLNWFHQLICVTYKLCNQPIRLESSSLLYSFKV